MTKFIVRTIREAPIWKTNHHDKNDWKTERNKEPGDPSKREIAQQLLKLPGPPEANKQPKGANILPGILSNY
ncbi:hypothetical protein KSZ_19680 [Dictyobacter formicarum]|uniref:Uncharacterized protein n=1 Tax=Dictyobacter formicarum TaxID=2778368 RepID=A0ABQ3VDH3_9CHLR|nr:hypothetical protein KSZ_19680 [Dictyobacter formicarum]